MTLGKKFGVTVYSVLIALIVITVAASCVQMCNENIGSKYNNINLDMQGAEVHIGASTQGSRMEPLQKRDFLAALQP